MKKANQTLATVESCTGGMVSESMTDLPGVSAVFLGSVVAYSNNVKSKVLGIDPALIAKHGAVSKEVAEAMASNGRQLLGADVAVSLTGVAGPDGGSTEKPVGTVWCGIADAHQTLTIKWALSGDRAAIRLAAAHQALLEVKKFVTRKA